MSGNFGALSWRRYAGAAASVAGMFFVGSACGIDHVEAFRLAAGGMGIAAVIATGAVLAQEAAKPPARRTDAPPRATTRRDGPVAVALVVDNASSAVADDDAALEAPIFATGSRMATRDAMSVH